MGFNENEAKLRIEDIYSSEVKTCSFESGFALRVEFNS